MPISANVTNNQITATVGETQIDVSVSGGVGPTGPQGPAGNNYQLPTASASVLGGVKIGSGISIDGSGVISASSGYTLPAATDATLGGVNVAAAGSNASTSQVVRGDDTRLTDSRSPTSHSHGNITSDGRVGTATGRVLRTTTNGVIYGASTVESGVISCGANFLSAIDQMVADVAVYGLPYVVDNNSVMQPLSHTHGNITNAGAIGSASGQIVVTTTSGVLTTAATISSSQVSGLGSLATQSSVAYSSLTGIPSTFTPASHTHSAAEITSGTVAVARLGSGSPSSANFLRGDGTWASAGSTSASDLTSGTLADARLSANARQAIDNLLHPFLLAGM